MAGSAHTVTKSYESETALEMRSTFTADDTNGSIPTVSFEPNSDVYIYSVEFLVGGTAPTAATDVTLVDEDGIDRLEAAGTNIAGASSTDQAVTYTSTNIHPIAFANRALTVTVSNNIVNSATGTLVFRFKKLRS